MRIVVADDDPDFRTLAIRALRGEFAEAEFLEVGTPQTLDAVLAGGCLDLLVTDYNLRWTDGFVILNAVRGRIPNCPAVMFTGTGNEEIAVQAIKAGFDDYVVKSPRQLRRLGAACALAVTRAETRRGLEQNRDILIQELYHRLHNSLQLVISLIAFTSRELEDPDAREKLQDLGRRVQSLSALQEKLYRGGDFQRVAFGTFLREFVDDLLGLSGQGVRAVLEIADVAMPVDLAVPMALLANELITNALKHAFPNGRGELTVVLVATPDGGYRLEVKDNGSGLLGTGTDAKGRLGMRLVTRLAQQMDAGIEMTARPGGGTVCRVDAPGRKQDAA